MNAKKVSIPRSTNINMNTNTDNVNTNTNTNTNTVCAEDLELGSAYECQEGEYSEKQPLKLLQHSLYLPQILLILKNRQGDPRSRGGVWSKVV